MGVPSLTSHGLARMALVGTCAGHENRSDERRRDELRTGGIRRCGRSRSCLACVLLAKSTYLRRVWPVGRCCHRWAIRCRLTTYWKTFTYAGLRGGWPDPFRNPVCCRCAGMPGTPRRPSVQLGRSGPYTGPLSCGRSGMIHAAARQNALGVGDGSSPCSSLSMRLRSCVAPSTRVLPPRGSHMDPGARSWGGLRTPLLGGSAVPSRA